MSPNVLVLAVCVCVSALARAAWAAEAVRVDEGRQPQVALTSKSVYVTYAKGAGVYCSRSTDGGRTFGQAVEVATPANMSVGMRRGPRIAATEEAIVITAVSGEQGGGKDGDVVGWRSTDFGATWTPLAAAFNRVPGAAREGLHAMAAGPKGQMFCVWLDLRNLKGGNAGHAGPAAHGKSGPDGKHETDGGHATTGGGTEIWGAMSIDYGKTWSRDFMIYRSPEKSVCQCCHPSVAYSADGKLVAVMFRNELAGNRDMYVVQSNNGGKTFAKARKLGKASWKLAACPMDGGMLAFPTKKGSGKSSSLTTVWRRASEIVTAPGNGPERTLGSGLQPWTASSSDGPYTVWITDRPGDLMLSRGEDQPEKLSAGASDPTIAASPDGTVVVAAWEQGSAVMVTAVRAQGQAEN